MPGKVGGAEGDHPSDRRRSFTLALDGASDEKAEMRNNQFIFFRLLACMALVVKVAPSRSLVYVAGFAWISSEFVPTPRCGSCCTEENKVLLWFFGIEEDSFLRKRGEEIPWRIGRKNRA